MDIIDLGIISFRILSLVTCSKKKIIACLCLCLNGIYGHMNAYTEMGREWLNIEIILHIKNIFIYVIFS